MVRDVERAKAFFALLGFKEAMSVVIKGPVFADYMGVPGIEAEHITLVLENATPRTEIQLLRYLNPETLPDPHIRDLNKLGMNHVCFAVDDIEAEVARLRGAGLQDAQRGHGFSCAQAGVHRRTGRRNDRTVAVAGRLSTSAPLRPLGRPPVDLGRDAATPVATHLGGDC